MNGLWQGLYDLLLGIIGSSGSFVWAEYTCQILATIGTIFVCVVPFIVVYYAIRFIFGLFSR